MKAFTSHIKALEYMRDEQFGRTLTYKEMAEILSEHCGEQVYKSEPWNAIHRRYRCPAKVKLALINMGLLETRRRYRFFYEVDEEKYRILQAWLDRHGFESFTDYMREEEGWLAWEE